jgi:hypothetical protein
MTVLGKSKFPLECQTCRMLYKGHCEDMLLDILCKPHLENKEP